MYIKCLFLNIQRRTLHYFMLGTVLYLFRDKEENIIWQQKLQKMLIKNEAVEENRKTPNFLNILLEFLNKFLVIEIGPKFDIGGLGQYEI